MGLATEVNKNLLISIPEEQYHFTKEKRNISAPTLTFQPVPEFLQGRLSEQTEDVEVEQCGTKN